MILCSYSDIEMLRKLIIIYCSIVAALHVHGQQANSLNDWLEKFIEDYIDFNELGEELDLNTLQEDILTFARSRPDFNKVRYETLLQLFFITPQEAMSIISYLDEYGPLISPYELQVIPDLSIDKARALSWIFEIGSKDQANNNHTLPLSIDNHQIFYKTRVPIEQAHGYQEGGIYQGTRDYQYLRIRKQSATGWSAGLTLEKDAGESWQDLKNGLFDFTSAFVSKTNITKAIRQVVIGDYRVNLGQGLLVNQSLRISKSSAVNQVMQGASVIRPYTSVDENNFYRGASIKIEPTRKTQIMLFGSSLARDASSVIVDDEMIGFRTLQTSGLHRTNAEINNRNSLNQHTLGGSVQFNPSRRVQLGFNQLSTFFSVPRIQASELYRQPEFHGSSVIQSSMDLRWFTNRFTAFGELARSANDALAGVSGLIVPLDRNIDLSAVYRNYSKSYQSINANGFSDSFGARNESGIYIGLSAKLNSRLTLNTFIDHWQHEWPRFRVDAPSKGNEFLARLDYRIRKSHSFYVQYRYRVREENSSLPSPINRLTPRSLERLRMHGELIVSPTLTTRSRIEFSRYVKDGINDKGLLVFQDFLWRPPRKPLSITARISYFETDSFNAAIYAFESDLTYEFQIPAFSGRGFRYYAVCKYRFNKFLKAEIKYAQSIFPNLENIGSGANKIEGNRQSIFKAQIIANF